MRLVYYYKMVIKIQHIRDHRSERHTNKTQTESPAPSWAVHDTWAGRHFVNSNLPHKKDCAIFLNYRATRVAL